MRKGRGRPREPAVAPGASSTTEAWFGKAFEHAPTGMAITDWDGRLELCNPAYRRLVGYEEDDLLSVDFADLVHPDDRAENLAALARLQAGDAPFIEIENRYLRPDGTSVWVHKYVSRLTAGDGGRDHLLALVTDMTERRRLEVLRRKGDEYFASMFESAAIGVAHVDLDGHFVRVNPAFAAITGRSREDLEGRRFQDITHPDDLELDLGLADQLAADEIPSYSLRKRYVRPDGTIVWVNLTGSVVRGPSGEPDYFVAVVEDVSADIAREEHERRTRELAELTAEVVSGMERATMLSEQAAIITDLLVPGFADFATVEDPTGDVPVLAVSHRDPALVPVLAELRSTHRLDAADPHSVARVLEGEHQVQTTGPQEREQFDLSERGRRLLDQLDPRSYLSLALDLGGGRRGVLLVGRSGPDHEAFTDQDLGFVERLTERAGVLFAGARLRRAEHDIAVRLQHALLPDHLATSEGLEVAGRYYAVGEALDVGGDWYDSIGLADGRILLVVGDVVGHGLDAAAVMGRLRAGLAALAARAFSPGRMLDELDRFARSPQGGDFATVAAAVLEPVSGTLTYASAGHPPLLVMEPWGTTRWLDDAGSVPLCTFPVEGRPEAAATLAPGSWLVLFSDGLLERRGETIDDGLHRVLTAAPAWRHGGAQSLCDGLIAELTGEADPEDDVVVLAVRYRPSADGVFLRRFAASPAELAPLRIDLRRWVEQHGLSPAAAGDLQLVVGEACANAVEHAYEGRTDGSVELTITPAGDELHIVVRDHGGWRPPGHTEGRGRGTGIMRALTTAFERTTGEDGTIVTMTLPTESEETT